MTEDQANELINHLADIAHELGRIHLLLERISNDIDRIEVNTRRLN